MHPLLQRQLQKHLGTATDLPPELHPLLAAVDAAYTQADDDRALLERSSDLTSQELLERNRELTDRNEELAAVRESALDCIIAMDHHGLVTEFNPAAERTFGFRREQILGKFLGDFLVPPAFRAGHKEGLARYLAGGPGPALGKRIEVPAVRADGSEFPVELAIGAVRAAAPDAPPRFVAYLRDISDRKAAEAQARHAEKLALVASRTDNAVVITDARGLIEWVNEGFTRISEYTLDDVRGKKPGALLQGPQTDPGTVASIRRSIAAGQGFKAEILNYAKSGRTYWLAIEVQPIRDAAGNITNFIAIESDITERKRMVEDLRAAKEAAEHASRAKSEFLANMSHEIRTPLNGVIGMVDLLLGTRLDERQSRYAQVVKSSADTLLALISQILDFSKIEAGKLDLEETQFDLRLAVEDVAEMLAQKAATKGLELACRIDPAVPTLVRGDPDRLRQILINLVNNSIKFTQTGEVLIRVLPHDSELGTRNSELNPQSQTLNPEPLLRFEVSDTGIGIPPDRMHRLFKSFSQVDASTTRRFGGTGLGLAISKQLAELMGGQIGARSEVGHGSTFWFTARLAPVARQDPSKLALDLTGRRVLVVDDNPTHAHILREQLAAWRVDVACAGSGPEAIQTIERATASPAAAFDMAILDLRMPDMDGLELAAALKTRPAAADLRLVLLSGVEALPPERYRAAGFAAAMAKPVRQSTLFDTLMRVMATPGGVSPNDAPTPTFTPAPAASTPDGAARKDVRILLAEDNEINQLVATELLARAGYACDAVPDGAKAVTAAATGRYALILMDCQMPELDGFEATRAIRRAEADAARGAHLPIVALTANAIKGDRERCLEAGMDAYVTKPLNPKELLETIETCLRTARTTTPSTTTPSFDVGCSMLDVQCSSSSSPGNPQTPPAIDVPSLLDRCMGNLAFLEKMLTKFRDQSDSTLTQLTTSVTARDPDATARAAHALKGAAANLSAPRVTEIAAQLEHLARAAQLDSADAALATLKSEMHRCLADIPHAITRAKSLTPKT